MWRRRKDGDLPAAVDATIDHYHQKQQLNHRDDNDHHDVMRRMGDDGELHIFHNHQNQQQNNVRARHHHHRRQHQPHQQAGGDYDDDRRLAPLLTTHSKAGTRVHTFGTPEACDAVCSARPCAALQLEELGGMHRWVCHGAPLPLPAAGASRDDVSGEGPPLLQHEGAVGRWSRVPGQPDLGQPALQPASTSATGTAPILNQHWLLLVVPLGVLLLLVLFIIVCQRCAAAATRTSSSAAAARSRRRRRRQQDEEEEAKANEKAKYKERAGSTGNCKQKAIEVKQ